MGTVRRGDLWTRVNGPEDCGFGSHHAKGVPSLTVWRIHLAPSAAGLRCGHRRGGCFDSSTRQCCRMRSAQSCDGLALRLTTWPVHMAEWLLAVRSILVPVAGASARPGADCWPALSGPRADCRRPPGAAQLAPGAGLRSPRRSTIRRQQTVKVVWQVWPHGVLPESLTVGPLGSHEQQRAHVGSSRSVGFGRASSLGARRWS
jgi:hypothetical protein